MYYPDTKIIDERTTYRNGIENSLYQKYYKNGRLSKKYTFKNGKLNCLYESWYDNGQLYIYKM